MSHVAIVGAGIIGLTTAYQLLHKGHEITIYAEAFAPDITSAKAAAFWFPYLILNDDRYIRWSQTSYEKYTSLAADPAAGISQQRLLKMVKEEDAAADMSWIDFMPKNACRPLEAEELKRGFRLGHEVQVPLIKTQCFLPWLVQQLERAGVSLIEQRIDDLHALANRHSGWLTAVAWEPGNFAGTGAFFRQGDR